MTASSRSISRIFAGVDVTKEPIPVLPTVHYNMVGIPTNYIGEVITVKDGDPNYVVPGFLVTGEAACASVHGAKGQVVNSLLDIVVFGGATANRMAELIKPNTLHKPWKGEEGIANMDRIRHATESTPTTQIRDRMQQSMQWHAAVFRMQDTLQAGVEEMDDIYASFADVKVTDPDMIETLELQDLLQNAVVTIHSAPSILLKRVRSPEAHMRVTTSLSAMLRIEPFS